MGALKAIAWGCHALRVLCSKARVHGASTPSPARRDLGEGARNPRASLWRILGLGLLLLWQTPVLKAASVADLGVAAYGWTPEVVVNGSTEAFTVTVKNFDAGSTVAPAMVLTIELPSNVDFSNQAAPSGCAFNLAANPKTLTCNKNTLNPFDATGDKWDIQFSGTPTTVGTVTTQATVRYADPVATVDPNPTNDVLVIPITVMTGSDLSIATMSAPSGASTGDTVAVSASVRNAGPDPASNLQVIMTLPAAVDFSLLGFDGTDWACRSFGTALTCDHVPATALAKNATTPAVTVSGQVRSGGGTITFGTVVHNTSPSAGDPNQSNNGPAVKTVAVTAATSLTALASLTGSTGSTVFSANQPVSLKLWASNSGLLAANGVTLSSALPTIFSVGSLPAGCSLSGQALSCAVGAVPAGSNTALSPFVIPLTVKANTPDGTGFVTTTVGRASPSGGSNTPATSSYSIGQAATHLMPSVVSRTPALALMTDTITHTLSLHNEAAYGATGTVRFTYALDANETYQGSQSSPSGWVCTGVAVGQTGTLTCSNDFPATAPLSATDWPTITVSTKVRSGTPDLSVLTSTMCTGSSISPHSPPDNQSSVCASRTNKVSGQATALNVGLTGASSFPAASTTYSYTIDVSNTGMGTAPTATVQSTVPGYLYGIGITARITSPASGESCSVSASLVTCSLRNVAPGVPRTITVTLTRPIKDGALSLQASISTDTAVDSPRSVQKAIQIEARPDIGISDMVASPNPTRVGVPVTFTTSIDNYGPGAPSSPVLRQTLDSARFDYIPNSATLTAGGTCQFVSAFGAGAHAGASGIECSGFAMDPDNSYQLMFRAYPRFPYPDTLNATYRSDATLSSAYDIDLSNNTSSASLSITPQSLDLSVTNQDIGYDPSILGQYIVYQITVSNNGPSRATGAKLTVRPLAPTSSTDNFAIRFNSASPTVLPRGATCTAASSSPGADVVCYMGSDASNSVLEVGAGGLRAFALRFDTSGVSALSSATFQTTATIESAETGPAPFRGDINPGNNTVVQTTTVQTTNDLYLTQSAPATVGMGQVFLYALTVGNLGPSTATQVRVNDSLPAGLVLASLPSGAGQSYNGIGVVAGTEAPLTSAACTAPAVGSNGTVSCTFGPLPAGPVNNPNRQVVVNIPVRFASYTLPAGTPVSNTASVSLQDSYATEASAANNSATASVTPTSQALSGMVFADHNLNQQVDSGEGLADVQITLTGTDSAGHTYQSGGDFPAFTTRTASDGSFSFTGLPAGTWTLVETQPTAYWDRFEIAGTAGGTVPAAICNGTTNCVPSAAANTISGIALQSGQSASGYLFQELAPATVSGRVFADANNDGVVNGSDAMLPGASVTLSGISYQGLDVCTLVTCTQSTGSNGSYSFNNLPPSSSQGYTLSATPPSGYSPGKAGVSATASGFGSAVGVASGSRIANVVLGPGGEAPGNDLGAIAASRLRGSVFADSNANARRDSTEALGYAGMTLTLEGVDDLNQTVSKTTTTTTDGSYAFEALRPGTYTLTESTLPAHATHMGAQAGSKGGSIGGTAVAAGVGMSGSSLRSISGIVLAAGDDASGYNFAETAQALSGTVYLDLDRNGTKAPSEPGIGGVTVSLSGTTSDGQDVCHVVACTTTTNSSGDYSLSGLPPSNATGYTLQLQATSAAPLSGLYGQGTLQVGVGLSTPGVVQSGAFAGIVVAGGASGTGYHFAQTLGSIAGAVYYDSNDNGVREASDPGLAGVSLTLSGSTASGTDVCTWLSSTLNKPCTTTTASDGSFSFAALPASGAAGYTLIETQPGGYANRSDSVGTGCGSANCGTAGASGGNSQFSAIGLGPGAQASGYLFGEKPGSISGKVYVDANDNGSQDPTESGVPGVSITLAGNMFDGSSVCTWLQSQGQTCTRTTDARGAYSFGQVPISDAAGYTLTETQPAAWGDFASGGAKVGQVGSTPTGSASGNNVIQGIVTSISGSVGTGYDFREKAGSISGFVYLDANNDGVKAGAGEAGISGVTIQLTGTTGAGVQVSLNTTTAADGSFSFIGLSAGSYSLAETQPASYLDGKETAGSASGVTSTNDQITGINLAAGVDATGYLFGELPAANGTISGKVYVDLDNSGTQNGSEPGVSSVTLSLTGRDNNNASVSLTATTGSDGSYSFNNVPTSDSTGYTITETQPSAWGDFASGGAKVGRLSAGTAGNASGNNTIQGIVTSINGSTGTGYDFREKAASIAGFVYVDTNNDGAKATSESGIAGVAIQLTGTTSTGSSVSLSTTTASDGSFSFTGLSAGSYSLAESQPTSYLDGKETSGSAGGGVATNDQITAIAMSAGTEATGYLFGELPAASGTISGKVYVDFDGNGTQGSGEPGVNGVVLTLSGRDIYGNTVNLTATTSSGASGDGNYTFSNVPASDATGYTITETQPTLWGDFASNGAKVGTLSAGTTGTVSGNNAIQGIVTSISGSTGSGYDFREKAASFVGFVYLDTNNDGAKATSESGIAGVAIQLTGITSTGATVSLSTTTGADGSFSFTGLSAGTYSLAETQPTSYLDGKETAGTASGQINNSAFGTDVNFNRIDQIALSAGVDATGYLFGELPAASGTISGKVYVDLDGNGTQGSGEPGVSGVTLTLTGKDIGNSAVNLTITTGSDGSYSFSNVPASDVTGYTITETQPIIWGDFASGGAKVGALSAGTAGNASGNNTIQGIVTSISGSTATGYDFREKAASIAGFVYVDINNDGAKAASESGIAGVAIQLTGTTSTGASVSLSTTTTADGSYSFKGLSAGTYSLIETQPASYQDGKETAGTASGQVHISSFGTEANLNRIDQIALSAGVDATGYLFGEQLAASGTISGKVYVDFDGNGTQGSGEPGVNGVVLALSGRDIYGNTVSLTTTTASASGSNGSYLFSNVPASDATGYTITETQPTLWGDFASNGAKVGTLNAGTTGTVSGNNAIQGIVTLVSGSTGMGYDFREKAASIAGFVYVDTNNDGAKAASESGIAGVAIQLTGITSTGATVSLSTTTGADGSFSFTGLSAGTYSLAETQPTSYLDGKETAGSASGVTSSNDQITSIALSAGTDATGYLFGERPAATSTLSGKVYVDTNDNNSQDTDEPGVSGVSLTLTGQDISNHSVSLTTTSASDGSYRFDNVPASNSTGYTVLSAQPSAWGSFSSNGAKVGAISAGTPGSATAGGNAIQGIVTSISGSLGTGYDFRKKGASLSGFIYVDANSNGSKDASEVGIAGVAVTLKDASGAALETVSTLANGSFVFQGLAAGSYSLAQAALSQYRDGTDALGSAGGSRAVKGQMTGIVLGAGVDAAGYLFGELPAASSSLSGKVYVDLNGDGSQGGVEPGVGGVTLTLAGTDILGSRVSLNVTTGNDGSYTFTNVPASDATGYTITETQPAAWGDFASGGARLGMLSTGTAGTVSGNNAIQGIVTSVGGSTGTGYDFREKGGSIAGLVYVDTNSDGAKSGASEVGIAGVALQLTGTTGAGAQINLNTTTAADGSFSFTGLSAGTYSLIETQPASYQDGKETAGTASGQVNNSSFGTKANLNRIDQIALSAGVDATGYLFGEQLAASGTISGKVYVDFDGSGTQNGSEPGVNGVVLTLSGKDIYGNSVNLTATTATASGNDGSYTFSNVPASDATGYTITETQPAAWGDFASGGARVGQVGSTTTGMTASNNAIQAIVTSIGGSTGMGYDFREKAGSISGFVYVDANNDGVRAATGEAGIGGVAIQLSGTTGSGVPISLNTTTAADGSYSFTGLSAGTYNLIETQPASYQDGKETAGMASGQVNISSFGTEANLNRIDQIALSAGVDATGYLFGELPAASGTISGKVYVDFDGSGTQNGSEPGVSGVTLTLAGKDIYNSPVSLTTVTGSDGSYTLGNVPASDAAGYTLSQTQPTAWGDFASGGAKPGQIGSATAGVAAGNNSIQGIVTRVSGGSAVGYDFREKAASLAGVVYLDANQNGLQDGGEAGIGGVAVQLTGTTASGVPISVNTSTRADGGFSFTGLSAGSYSLVETQPVRYVDGRETAGTASGQVNNSAFGNDASLNRIDQIALPAGVDATGYLFGEQPGLPGSISGRVYADDNRNGQADAGEGLPGVTVRLVGASVSTSPPTVQTDAEGRYRFENVKPGVYTVVHVPVTGYLDYPGADGTDVGSINGSRVGTAALNLISGVDLPSGAQGVGYDFREIGSRIEGMVYVDNDHNGRVDAGEAGLAGVTITLREATGRITRSTQTDAQGRYQFIALPAGTYTLEEAQPPGYFDGKETAGSAGGQVNNSGFGSGANLNRIDQITVPAGTVATGYLFGERRGSLSGFVYVDANDNGAKDSGESGLGGIEVRLSGTQADGQDVCAANPAYCVATTSASGAFRWDGLAPGTYTLTENQLQVDALKKSNGAPLYSDGKETAGTAGGQVSNTAFGSQALYNRITQINLSAEALIANDGAVQGYLFGERLFVAATATPSKPSTQATVAAEIRYPIVSGFVYVDTDQSRVRKTTQVDERVQGWQVELKASRSDGQKEVICTTQTSEVGFYQFDNVACGAQRPEFSQGLPASGTTTPHSPDIRYQHFELAWSNPKTGISTTAQSSGDVGDPTAAAGKIVAIQIHPDDQIVEQNLPLDPSGVVYDAVTRRPVAGAQVTLLIDANQVVPTSCLSAGETNPMVTGSDGFYKFLIQLGAGCSLSLGTHSLKLTVVPPSGYVPNLPNISALIPPSPGPHEPPPQAVQGVDAIQSQSTAPQPGQATTWYQTFSITASGIPASSSADIVNNHIPLDPLSNGAILMTKTTPQVNVARGDLVAYTLTATNTSGVALDQITVLDRLPPGFRYRTGSTLLNGLPMEPVVSGRDLSWPNQSFRVGEKMTWKMMLVPGAGVGDGEYTNQTWSQSAATGNLVSNIASAAVRVVPDPTFDCSDLIGKVFDDKNANGYQDDDEPGIPGVRLVTVRGLIITTDPEGRFHVACADVPQLDHGSNFVIKLDERTLPTGYRLTTENPRDVRLTRGKMVKMNFGSTIHRVVRVDMKADAFRPRSNELAQEWERKLLGLMPTLEQRPSILRLAYERGNELRSTVQSRLDALSKHIQQIWKQDHESKAGAQAPPQYPLIIEMEVLGGP